MIPAAAFAVTVTGASAFGGNWYLNDELDLSDSQIAAFEEAQEIREAAREDAKGVLEDAGIDEETMQELHQKMRTIRDDAREVTHAALEGGDYEAFVEAIAGSPLADVITSEADFEKFVEAHELRQDGDFESAQEIMDELGVEGRGFGMNRGNGMGGERGHGFGGSDI